jgi:hypothetical protein
MKNFFLFLILFFLTFSLPKTLLASSATSVVETKVEGEAKVYQSVETTIDGETVRKESSLPGKMELKMEKTGEGKPTVSFSQSSQNLPSLETTPQPEKVLKEVSEVKSERPLSLFSKLFNFFQSLISRIFKF